jgi:hypothetical protein
MVSTETGILVLGTTARFRFTPPAVKSFNKKAKASEKRHCEVPYSSEANKKEKLKLGVLG